MDILFIGNSYTGNLRAPFCEVMQTLHPAAVMQFRTGGGWSLAHHVDDPAVKAAIDSRKWDIVVLQEQSRIPTFTTASQTYRAHREAIRTLVGWVRHNGAEPVLYETWGRRDGDNGSPKRSPDFDTMQAHLTRAYRDAGCELDLRVVPAGQVWQAVRHANPALGHALHAPDGSHASPHGSYLLALTFAHALLGEDNPTLTPPPTMTPAEAALIQRTVAATLASEAPRF
jgi:hypothetical protein